MYKGISEIQKGFIANVNVDGFDFILDKDKELSTTPVGFLTVAVLGCVGMSARGYFIKFHKRDDVQIKLDGTVNTDGFDVSKWSIDVNLDVDFELDSNEKDELYKYIKKVCTVSKLLTENVPFNINIKGR